MSGAIPLNPAQKAAIEHRGSPALVLAGALVLQLRSAPERDALVEAGAGPVV